MLKIVATSDSHGLHRKYGQLPKGDVLIHAGDTCNSGKLSDLSDFVLWLDKQEFEHKIVIAGNHDRCLQDKSAAAENLLKGKCTYLLDSSVEIEGFKFYGSPWQPEFNNWAFNLPRGGEELKNKWDLIPDDTDILITHGPPQGILDVANDGFVCGCEHLAARILEVRPKYHIFGHVHEGYGMRRRDDEYTTYVNVARCTHNYKPINEPVELIIKRM